jgi:hypothetical protein
MKALTGNKPKYGFGRLIAALAVAKHGRPVVVVMAVAPDAPLAALVAKRKVKE